jgi:hypothetical protein
MSATPVALCCFAALRETLRSGAEEEHPLGHRAPEHSDGSGYGIFCNRNGVRLVENTECGRASGMDCYCGRQGTETTAWTEVEWCLHNLDYLVLRILHQWTAAWDAIRDVEKRFSTSIQFHPEVGPKNLLFFLISPHTRAQSATLCAKDALAHEVRNVETETILHDNSS